jgi:predicted transcriptional regulator
LTLKVKKGKSSFYTSCIKHKGYKMIITKHGYKRIKERLGLPKRAQSRHIKAVLTNGALIAREGRERFEMVHQGFLYIFALTPELEPILVTTFRDELM